MVPPCPFALAAAGGEVRYDVLIRFKKGVVGPLFSGPYAQGSTAWKEAKKGCKALRCGKLYKNLAGTQAQKKVVGFDPIRDYYTTLVRRYVREVLKRVFCWGKNVSLIPPTHSHLFCGIHSSSTGFDII